MAESYSCGGSPYWAAKGFSFMSLPPEHPFWNDEEQPIPAEEGDYVVPLQRAGLVFRNFDGRSEIFNAGVAVAICNTRFGPFKWGKLAYRSGVGTLLPKADQIPFDMSLVATSTDGTLYGRHMTTPLELSEECVISSYSLGTKNEDVHISLRTMIFWKKGWLLLVHAGETHQACTLSQGSFALAEKALVDQDGVDAGFAVIESSSTTASLQNLSGYSSITRICSRADGPRQHSHAAHHQLLRADCELSEAGSFCLASICGEGEQGDFSIPWERVHSSQGELKLIHPKAGEWHIQHPMLAQLSLR